MKLNSIITAMLIVLSCAFGMISCDVHEFPVIPEKVPFTLTLNCKTQIPIHEEINYTTRSGNETEEHDMRYIVNVYRSYDGENFTRVPDTTIVYTRHLSEEQNHSIQLYLREGFYNLVVWCDHVGRGTDSDKYYNTGDFAKITYSDRDSYEGCNDFQDAFRGTTQVAIQYDQYPNGGVVEQEAVIHLERPLAKFKFISTDLEEYIAQLLGKYELKDRTVTRTINPDDYRVVFRYTKLMPCSFNMFTNKPNDSWTGMSFDGRMVPIDEHEIELGFDYVFVNGTESRVDVAVEIYDNAGELLSRSRSIEVPLVRSKQTIVKGNFLTSKASGGVTINPEYSGNDFNIEIK